MKFNGKKSYLGGVMLAVSGGCFIASALLDFDIRYAIGITCIGMGVAVSGLAHKVSKFSRLVRPSRF
jgi:hypothetical protein